jgi:nitroreductase
MDLVTIDHVLTTTRTVRKRLDLTRPVDPNILQQSIDIAIQAPTGGDMAWYHFMIVVDPAKRAGLASLYRKAFYEDYLPRRREHFEANPRFAASGTYLVEHLHEVPVHIIPCFEGRVEHESLFRQATRYGCILPAAWSLMLALRARGLGSAWTTLHLLYEKEAASLLGIPEHITQAALLPVAYFTGADFKPAKRVPGRERTYWDAWGRAR